TPDDRRAAMRRIVEGGGPRSHDLRSSSEPRVRVTARACSSAFTAVARPGARNGCEHRSGVDENSSPPWRKLLSLPGWRPGTTCSMRTVRLSKPLLSTRPISKDGHIVATQGCPGRVDLWPQGIS